MILTDKQARVLDYIHEANEGGARPTGKQIREWRKEPRRRPAQRGELIRAAVPGTPARRVYEPASMFKVDTATHVRALVEPFSQTQARMMRGAFGPYAGVSAAAMSKSLKEFTGAGALAGLGGTYREIPGTPGTPAQYGPDVPREGFLDHLRRLGWVERNKAKTYALTDLGRALLRRYHFQDATGDEEAIFLGGEEGNVDYSRLIGRIAELGEAMVLDAYLGAEQVRDLLEHTQVNRFLVSSKRGLDGRAATAGVQLSTWKEKAGDTSKELRRADFHDRIIVSESSVHVLGASFNGVRKGSPTVLYRMPGAAADAMRRYAEELWKSAQDNAMTQGLDRGAE